MIGAALTLAQPGALWGLAAAAPILALHLYFRRRRRVLVAFVPLLAESLGPVRREARLRRLRETASLAARLLALACVVLALAGLRPAGAQTVHPDLLIVLDADVTTAAREEDGVLRVEHGRRLAQALGASVPATEDGRLGARVGIVLAGAAPQLLLAPTRDAGLLRRALEGERRPAPGPADLEAAVALALEAAAPGAATRVAVLSARAYEPPETPPGVRIEILGVGRTRADQGFETFEVEPGAEGAAYDVRAALRNHETVPRTRALVVRVDGREIARQATALPPGTSVPVRLRVPAPARAAWLDVALEGEDAFPANDRLEARLAPLPLPSLLVVHGGRVRPYTAAVVEALAKEGLVDATRSGFVAAADLARASRRDVTVVDGVALPPDALTPGAYVFLAPLAGALPFELGPEVQQPLVWRTLPGHPLVEGLDFQRAFVVRGRTLGGPGLQALAFAEGRPIVAEGERAGVRYVVLGLDPEGSMLPTQAALPLLVRKAVLRLAQAPVAPLRPLYARGAALRPRVDLPGGPTARIAWDGPRGDAVLAAAAAGGAVGRMAPEGSVWRVPAGASGRARVQTGAGGAAGWVGFTALINLDPERTIVPVREAAASPAAAPMRSSGADGWRRALLVAAVLLLVLDLLLVIRARRALAPT